MSAANRRGQRESSDRGIRQQRIGELLSGGEIRELPDEEILELLIAYSASRRDVQAVAEELLRRFGNLTGILKASSVELSTVKGVGKHGASLFRLVGEIMTRCAERAAAAPEMLTHPREMERFLISRFAGLKEESFLLIFLDQQGVVLGEQLVGAGTVDQVVAFPRQLMVIALRYNASRLIIAHNHPHGPPLPSKRDTEEAQRLRDILRPFDITVEDSIVVGQNRCFSIFKSSPL